MAKKKGTEQITLWLFIIGLIIAIVAPFLIGLDLVWLLVLIGVIVGLLNITAKEVNSFLIATVALVIASNSLQVWSLLTSILDNVVILVAPAAIIVAVKAVYALASKK